MVEMVMRVEELIDALKEMPQNVVVYVDDGEYGPYTIGHVENDEKLGVVLR